MKLLTYLTTMPPNCCLMHLTTCALWRVPLRASVHLSAL
ncbi:hypothetical protein E2C01_093768 [Portunus trituberculatus]|uniref:Uncharacterized protein n=1 Tax=Portunus trituberculatus TaxID=210409 RepID=A0A5B7JUD3_PORTR|nr:hypothetical protein [Portunus trituberculatus]